ncbi:hypothetical protein HZY97_04225 [Sphingomonas sp. R-74633]|uniref:hypothetical protein n=1 Tax=Sphingomonas sp. R-74633 TaxID=2751188 RepID=UPI0015D13402|nr:hypothetical protein [Sphingomonas sp. R-74633]NYT39951.1 hypothetical protein [Sphingomonas sp. R-74633]
MRARLASLFLLSSFAAIPLAYAQEAPKQSQDGNIVVTGQAQKPIKKAQRYIRQVLDTQDGQLARFIDPVCPLVIGLPERFKASIEDRIRTVGSATSVRMAKEKCEPNLMIVFAEDSDALIQLMRKRRNAAFTNLDDGALRDAFQKGPIHAWRLVVTRDEVGNISTGNDDPDYPPMMEGDTQAVTINAVVVMDRKVALGKSVRQLGDYVVMRTLVGAKPPAKGSIASASILSLFDPNVAPPPTEITDMDLGLLAGLYHLRNPNEQASDQAWRISRGMVSGKQR